MNLSGNSPSPTSASDRNTAYLVLLSGTLIIGMGQTIVFAVLPALARRMGLHDMQVLSIFMTSAVFWVTLGPIWGQLSDRKGRRTFILLGLSAYAVSMTLFATVITNGLSGAITGMLLYIALLVTRSLYGLFGSAMPPAAQAYIADRTTPENRTARLAGFSAAFGLGGMIGPAFAGALASVSEVAPLFGVAILSFCSILIISAKVTERSAPKERKAIARLSPTDRRIRLYLIFGFASATVTAIPIQFASFYVIDRIGISPADALGAAGIALSTGAGASLFAQIALVQRFNLKPFLLLRAGPALLLAGHLAIALSQDIGALTFGMMLGGLGAGLVTPGYVGAASLAVSVDEQGAVAGLSNAAAASSYIVAPPLGYLIYAINPVFLFIATAGIAASTLVLALCSPRLGKPPQATG